MNCYRRPSKGRSYRRCGGLRGLNTNDSPDASEPVFLPDFCAIPVVFSVVIIGQLLAFVLVLGSGGASEAWAGWGELALTSLFIQWVGLTSAAILCVVRRWLRGTSDAVAAWIGFATIVVVTGAATEVGYWLITAERAVVGNGLERGTLSALWFAQAGGGGGSLLARNLLVAAIVAAVALRYFFVQAQWRRQLERESEARVQALQSRIRPHFLFNSMNTIAAFTRSDPDVAEQVVEDLADLFRMSLGDARVPTQLGRELELCRQYVRIERLRLSERLCVEWQIDGLAAAGDAALPALTLQPLIENAVYHGIEPAPEGGRIVVGGYVAEGRVAVSLTNSKPREPSARLGHQMALENVRERMTAFFAGQAAVEVHEEPDRYTVTLRFPLVKAAKS